MQKATENEVFVAGRLFVAWLGVAWRATQDKWTNDERKEKGNRREMRCNPLRAFIIANIYKSPSTPYLLLILAAAAAAERFSSQRTACRENTHSQKENEKRSFSFFFDIRPSVLFVLVV